MNSNDKILLASFSEKLDPRVERYTVLLVAQPLECEKVGKNKPYWIKNDSEKSTKPVIQWYFLKYHMRCLWSIDLALIKVAAKGYFF